MVWRPLLPATSRTPKGWVYLLHFSRPVGTEGRGSAQHYIGFTEREDVLDRLVEHLSCSGAASRLVRHAIAAGVDVTLAWVSPERVTLREEYRLKNRGSAKRWCPHCTGTPVSLSSRGTNRAT